MSINESSYALSKLLLDASTHHMRFLLETLPTGLIEVNQDGIIESIDDWTSQTLGFRIGDLRGRSISLLFEDSTFDFLQLIRKRHYGRVGRILLRTESGVPVSAELVLKPSMQLHKFIFSIIYTTEYSL